MSSKQMRETIQKERQVGAQNYQPLPVVLTRGQGVYLWDMHDKRYIDMMSAYSAVSHGHCHPKLVTALQHQAERLAVVSRAYHTDQLAEFLHELCRLTHQDKALPMNTGAEAVETALKAARKWAYTVKGVAPDKAEVIVCDNNFHGRTITIVGMSSCEQYREGFGPFPEGFKIIPFDNLAALEEAITENTAAFLLEPIQGEGGIVLPSPGYLKQCAAICKKNNVLFIADEIQTGMGRTGALLAVDHEQVVPDGLILGKALGGGLYPVSAFLSRSDVMDVFQPGDHGSTFGGNQLAAVVGLAALKVLQEEHLVTRSRDLGQYLLEQLQAIKSPLIKEVRGKGLFIGIEIDPKKASARDVCLALMEKGLLSKETHETVVRLAPPLVITKEQIDEALTMIKTVLQEMAHGQN